MDVGLLCINTDRKDCTAATGNTFKILLKLYFECLKSKPVLHLLNSIFVLFETLPKGTYLEVVH